MIEKSSKKKDCGTFLKDGASTYIVFKKTAAWFFLIAFLTLVASSLPVFGAGEGPENESESAAGQGADSGFTAGDIQSRIAELDATVEELRKTTGDGKDGDAGTDAAAFQERLTILSKIKSAYLNLTAAQEKNDQLNSEEAAVRKSLSAPPEESVSKPPPYSLGFYDELTSQLEIVRQKKESAEFALKMARLSVGDVDANLEKAGDLLEEIERLNGTGAPATIGPGADERLAATRLDFELASVNERISNIVLDNHTREKRLFELKSDLLKKEIEWVKDHLDFHPDDLKQHLEKIEERQKELEEHRHKLLEEQQDIENKWHEARKRLLQNVYKDKEETLKAETLAREAWLNTYHVVLEQIGNRIRLLEYEKDIARKRYDLISGKTERPMLLQWEGDLEKQDAELNKLLSLQQNYQATLQSQMILLQNQLDETPSASPLKKHLETHIDAEKKLAERYSEYIMDILHTLNLQQRFNSEIDARLSQIGISGKVWALMAKSRILGAVIIITAAILLSILAALFINRILTAIVKRTNRRLDDQILDLLRKPVLVTIVLVGASASVKWLRPGPPFDFVILSVLKTFLILLWCLTIVRIFRSVGQNFISSWRRSGRQGIEMIRLAENIARLVVIVGGIFLFLSTWNINITPLLASAGIAGVAVALAAKETLSNLFGGISLMLDQPFKTGDYIVLDSGERGEVREIGLRSTRVWTRDDVLISIPNSIITNSKIVNESAPLSRFRARVKIGVAYGSDVKQVEEILLDVARKNTMVVQYPEPRVRFRNFGDSSLDFELLCWGSSPDQKGRLIHALNCEVYEAFNKQGVSIPFPQRDVHLFNLSGKQHMD